MPELNSQQFGYEKTHLAQAAGGSRTYSPGLTHVKPGELGSGIKVNANVESLRGQLRQSGKVFPLEMDSTGLIVDGEHRYRALSDLGVKRIPVYVGKQMGGSGRLEKPYSGIRHDIKWE